MHHLARQQHSHTSFTAQEFAQITGDSAQTNSKTSDHIAWRWLNLLQLNLHFQQRHMRHVCCGFHNTWWTILLVVVLLHSVICFLIILAEAFANITESQVSLSFVTLTSVWYTGMTKAKEETQIHFPVASKQLSWVEVGRGNLPKEEEKPSRQFQELGELWHLNSYLFEKGGEVRTPEALPSSKQWAISGGFFVFLLFWVFF